MSQVQNPIAELDVDIEIDEVNETPTLQIEQFEQATQMMSSGVFGQPPHPKMVELWIKTSNFRDKDALLSIVEEMAQQQAQPNPLQQAAAEAEVAGKQADAALTGAKAEGEQIKNQLIIPQAHMDAMHSGMNAGVSSTSR
jgi:hypothetical protein